MTVINLQIEALTQEAFLPYGDVIVANGSNQVIPINYGLTERHHDLAKIDVTDAGGHAIVSLFKTQAIHLPFSVKIMERHPLGSQTFVMTTGKPYIVIVSEAGEFDPTRLRAFLATPEQGVNYHKGTWHHYCLGLECENQFLVIDRSGEGNNCDEVEIPDTLSIVVNH